MSPNPLQPVFSPPGNQLRLSADPGSITASVTLRAAPPSQKWAQALSRPRQCHCVGHTDYEGQRPAVLAERSNFALIC